MRLRFFLTFSVIALVSVLAVVVFFSIDAGNQVRQYIAQGGMFGLDELVQQLEDYYNQNSSWDGVQSLAANFVQQNGMHFGQGRGQQNGQGMMMGRSSMNLDLYLVDANGNLLYDSAGTGTADPFSASDLAQGIALTANGGTTVGYLLVPGAVVTAPANQQRLIDKITTAGLRAGLVALVIALLLTSLLSGSLLRPIRALSKAAPWLNLQISLTARKR